jgi:hypothetical protein
MGGEEFELRIVAQPDDVPPVNRLRHVLKALLRAHRFRAVSVRDLTPLLRPVAEPPLAADEVTGASKTPLVAQAPVTTPVLHPRSGQERPT